jgi:urease beta subunit
MAKQEIIYEGKQNISIQEFIDSNVFIDGIKVKSSLLLKFDGETGLINLDRIWSKYNDEEKEEYASNYSSGDLPYIKPNTTILVPRSAIELETTILYGINQFYEHKDYPAFWGENQEKLRSLDGYVNHRKLTFKGGVNATIRNENIRIYVVRKDSAGFVIEDLTPNIVTCQTSKNFNSGTFNFTVSEPPIHTKDVRGSDIINYENIDGEDTSVNDGGYYSRVIGNNDLVFIRYEQLGLENEEYKSSHLSPQSLAAYSEEERKPKRTWDMIGLVTNVVTTYNSFSTERTVNINGQDLTKLLTEDGSYFIPLRFVEGSNKRFFFGGNAEDGWFKRNVVSGDFNFFFAYKVKSIRETVGFIINHLSNIGLVDDRVFDGYGDRRSKVFELDPVKSAYKDTKEVKGVWQIVKFFIDSASEERRVADDSFVNPEGTLLEFFQRVCQMPFVEFFGDTYIDTFDFIIRKPPFDREAIQSVVRDGKYIEIDNSDLYSYNLYFDERNYSWYQIQPQNGLYADDGYTSLTYLPIIYFPQIAEVFGNKRLITPNNYISVEAMGGNKENEKYNMFIRKMLNDYLFMIESNIYLPFTRKGNITLNGDRRIKVGSFVKLNKTNELLYVTGVSQYGNYSNQIDRTTTIQVERGMVFDYVLGNGATNTEGFNTTETVNVQNSRINYFNILNYDLVKKTILYRIEDIGGGAKIAEKDTATFGLNESIFKFFLNRNQMKFNKNQVFQSRGLNSDGSLIIVE